MHFYVRAFVFCMCVCVSIYRYHTHIDTHTYIYMLYVDTITFRLRKFAKLAVGCTLLVEGSDLLGLAASHSVLGHGRSPMF